MNRFFVVGVLALFASACGGGSPSSPDPPIPDPSKFPPARISKIEIYEGVVCNICPPLRLIPQEDYGKLGSLSHTTKIYLSHASWPNRRITGEIRATFQPAIREINLPESQASMIEYLFGRAQNVSDNRIMIRLVETGEGLTEPVNIFEDVIVGFQ